MELNANWSKQGKQNNSPTNPVVAVATFLFHTPFTFIFRFSQFSNPFKRNLRQFSTQNLQRSNLSTLFSHQELESETPFLPL